jgi:hypothetical protein
MPRKKVTKKVSENNVLMLPSNNKEMESFIKTNKKGLIEQALTSIEFAVTNKLPFVEIFKFNNSDFVITVSEKDYLVNVNHIYNFYLETENYELCPRAVKLQSALKYINSNEKEIEIQINRDSQ